jgi:hypothetical protein
MRWGLAIGEAVAKKKGCRHEVAAFLFGVRRFLFPFFVRLTNTEDRQSDSAFRSKKGQTLNVERRACEEACKAARIFAILRACPLSREPCRLLKAWPGGYRAGVPDPKNEIAG